MERPETHTVPNPEHRASTDSIDIYLQRHGQRGPDGWLTEKGIEQVKTETARIVEQYLESGAPPVTFFVLNSPSAAFVDDQPAGRRAEHSGRVAAETIEAVIASSGRDEGSARLHQFGRTEAGTRAHKELSEPNYYYVDGSDNPTGYFDALIETVGKEGREEGFFNGTSELEDLRKEVGADSSPDVGARIVKLVRVIKRYSEAYHREYPDRKLVFLLESHGDVIRSTVQHGLGVEESRGWQPDTGQSVKLELMAGELSMDYNGMQYDIKLRPSKADDTKV